MINDTFYSQRNLDVEQLKNLITNNSNRGLTGLKNLGNSCSLNTVLQCLSHSLELTYYFLSKLYLKEININISNSNVRRGIGVKPGHVANLMYKVLYSLWIDNDNEKIFNPSEIKYFIANTNSQFNNNNQQDSHELLIYLLDLIHEDLNIPVVRGITEINTENTVNTLPAIKFWNCYRERNNSIVVDLFHGQLKSTVTCLVCDKQSITYQPFVTLPLAIPKMRKIDLIIVPAINIKSTIALTIYVSESALFIDLGNYLKKYVEMKLDRNSSRVIHVNAKTYTAKFVKNSENIYHTAKKGYLFVHEIDERIISGNENFYPFIALVKSKIPDDKFRSPASDSNANNTQTNNTQTNTNIRGTGSNTGTYLSYPRLFITKYTNTIKDLRIAIYGHMRRYYTITTSIKYDNIVKNYLESKYIDYSEYDTLIREEYNMIFGNLTDADYYSDAAKDNLLPPYKVLLISSKDETTSKLFFSNCPKDYNQILSDDSTMEKLVDLIKSGYKLQIEFDAFDPGNVSANPNMSHRLNKMIQIKNKNSENDFTKIVSIYDCLDHFRLTEKLEKGNEYYCESCKKLQNALIQVDIFYLPKYFIIYLNRFDIKVLGKCKIQILKNNSFVKYPVNGLNMNEYCDIQISKDKNLYDLYAVSQHSGSVEGGHQATACRNFSKWYEFDDISIFPSDENLVVSPEGYILFFRKKYLN